MDSETFGFSVDFTMDIPRHGLIRFQSDHCAHNDLFGYRCILGAGFLFITYILGHYVLPAACMLILSYIYCTCVDMEFYKILLVPIIAIYLFQISRFQESVQRFQNN